MHDVVAGTLQFQPPISRHSWYLKFCEGPEDEELSTHIFLMCEFISGALIEVNREEKIGMFLLSNLTSRECTSNLC